MKNHLARVVAALLLAVLLIGSPQSRAEEKLKVLLIDGQNNHAWKETTPVLKWILEESGRFTVDVSTTPPAKPQPPRLNVKGEATEQQKADFAKKMSTWKAEKAQHESESKAQWEQWHPKFKDYAVVVSNYNGEAWPPAVRSEFVDFVKNGGGFVTVHAADNSFGDWPEYNEMIGVGGWGGRNEKSGPMIRFNDGKFTRDESPGAGGTHGSQHEFIVETRDPEHPILKGLPAKWKHAKDELYAKLRGPAKDMEVIATAFSAPAERGTGENEPMLMVISYGKGRIFHTTLGHSVESMSGLGFQVTLCRGTEWAATGVVTLPAPKESDLTVGEVVKRLPSSDKKSSK